MALQVVGAAALTSALRSVARAGTAASDVPQVATLSVERFFDWGTRLHQFFFSGTDAASTARSRS
jgi:hypothetical protein